MSKLIIDGVIVDDTWQLLEKPEDASAAVPAGKVIVHLSVWQQQKDALSARDDIGVWLDNVDTADLLGDDAKQLPLVAVNFPVFMDGRGFSAARLLRERYGFTGELRAIGNFIRDQLCYLKRCGVNAFACSSEIDMEKALASLNDFTDGYQTAVDTPVPLFRRKA